MQVRVEIISVTSFNSFQRAVTLKRNAPFVLTNVFYMKEPRPISGFRFAI